MIQLPYRDIIPQGDSGGSIEEGINAYKEKYHGKKRNCPSYKSKWEEEVKEKKRWRRRFIAAGLTLIALMIFEAFGRG
jgi:hypothetical protein